LTLSISVLRTKSWTLGPHEGKSLYDLTVEDLAAMLESVDKWLSEKKMKLGDLDSSRQKLYQIYQAELAFRKGN
jgi:hypothetical protein